MADPIWNKIEFEYWCRGNMTISVNPFGEGPIVLELEGSGYDDTDQSEWMMPSEARELAAKLIEAADAAEKAGMRSAVGGAR